MNDFTKNKPLDRSIFVMKIKIHDNEETESISDHDLKNKVKQGRGFATIVTFVPYFSVDGETLTDPIR